MKKLICALAILMSLTVLAVPVSARSNAQQMQVTASVGSDGGCQVTVSFTVSFDETVVDPVFPVPADATNVTLNGGAVNATAGDLSRNVSLNSVTGGAPGTYSLTITYHLDHAAKAQKDGTMLLTVPILSGFAYPVDAMTVNVELPGEVQAEPSFISGYYQEYTDKLLKTAISGNTINIVSQQTLLDHETLTMTLQVEEEMFPGTAAAARVMGLLDVAVLIAALLAVVYYGLTLRPTLPRKVLRTTAPDGISAGELPAWFVGGTADLSLMVVSWAQLGYLRIEVTADGRVLLHKRMEMGNERSNFENRCYKTLFGRRHVLDAGSDHYARMVRITGKKGSRRGDVYVKKSGDSRIFLGLCGLSALLSGISLAGAMAPDSGFLGFLFAVLMTLLAWLVQSGPRGLILRQKRPLWLAAAAGGLWLILGIAGGQWLITVLMIAFQVAAGVLAAYGGRRTELGQQALKQILGMRKFMRTAGKMELQRLLKANPGYFHEMLPYALALGTDKAFAARFERLRMPECSYLVCSRSQMTAAEWAAVLRKAVETMDAKAMQMLPWQK